ncbi:MAG: glycosyltransferase family 4 protein [Chthoniobacteraceae bacterium]
MKILLVSTSSGSRGGGELCLLYLGRALRDRGHCVTLWVSRHPRMDELAARFGEFGEITRADYTNTYDRRGRSIASYFDSATANRVAAQWQEMGPDVIHLNKQNLEDGLDLVEAVRRCAIPALVMIHITQSASYLQAQFATVRDFIARRALRRFPGLWVTTPESRRRDLARFLGDADRVRVVANGVPIPNLAGHGASREEVRRELHVAEEQLLVVAVGRMVPQKRPLLFLETAARIHAQIQHARFLWIGDGALANAWDEWIADHKIGHVVQRLPWREDVPRLLNAADVFVHVAEFEGLAFAILEALAAGLPCAITPNLLAEMPFLDAHNSISIEPGDEWIRQLQDRNQLGAMGRAAGRLAAEQFSFSRMAADYEALYREAIDSRR